MAHRGLKIDLMCGLGGTSEGMRQSTGKSPDIVVNHNQHAIALHKLNHPDSRHFCDDVRALKPIDITGGRRVDLISISPDCRHFSRAKGGAPVSASVRALAWETIRWAKETRAAAIYLENVPEFQGWGPVNDEGIAIPERKGETFHEFLAALNDLGYKHESRILNAADYGTPTTRTRFFLGARRDGQPVPWPVPTHGPGRSRPWRAAAECIDWSIPCHSIFGRKKPLADATCRRIARGIMRHVIGETSPFLVEVAHGEKGRSAGGRIHSLNNPIGAITKTNNHALVTAFISKFFTGETGHNVSLREPLATITTRDHNSLVAANLIQIGYGERAGQLPRCLDLRSPLGTIVAGGCKHALVAAFLTEYYGSGNNASLHAPLHTVTTRDRHALVVIEVDGATYVIEDIGMRMLAPRELARAQGFPDSYLLEGSKADQIARIGNAVCPPVAEALFRAYYGYRPSLS